MSLLYWSLSEVAARPRFREFVDEVSDDIMSGLKADDEVLDDDIWLDELFEGFVWEVCSEFEVFESGDISLETGGIESIFHLEH